MEKFVDIYHEFLKSNLLWRHISSIGKCLPSDMQTNRQNIFLPDFSESVKTKKKTLVKRIIELWELLRCILTKWAKKEKKERKNSKQNLWILIDMKKTKTCSKTRKKNKQQWYIIVWQTNFFAFCFLFKKMTPRGNFI